jgi:hypothetical protein
MKEGRVWNEVRPWKKGGEEGRMWKKVRAWKKGRMRREEKREGKTWKKGRKGMEGRKDMYRFTVVWDVAITSRGVTFQEPERGWNILRFCGS